MEPSPSTSVYAGAVVVSPYLVLEYGADGILSSEVVNLAPTTTHYGYDLVGMGQLPQRIAEFNGAAVLTSYFYSVGSDRVLETMQGASGYFFHRDVLGSTTTVTDSTSRVRATYRYDAYGNLLPGSSDTIGNPLRFTGLASDATSGLLYARARWYDPRTGRFLTPDPLGSAGTSAYAYAGGNPVNNVDPSGMAFVNLGALKEPEGIMGDIGVGCNEDQFLSNGCAPPPPPSFSMDRCAPDLALFMINTVAGLVGVYIPESDALYAVPRALELLNTYAPDGISLYRELSTYSSTDGSNLGGVVGSVLGLLWDMGVELVKAIFKALGRDLFAEIAAGLSLGGDLVPGVIEARLLFWGIGTMIGAAGLATDGCVPGQ